MNQIYQWKMKVMKYIMKFNTEKEIIIVRSLIFTNKNKKKKKHDFSSDSYDKNQNIILI